jgi:hypothetical protein
MKGERLDAMRGSGNVFRDLGHEDTDVEQVKAILAAEIIKALDREVECARGTAPDGDRGGRLLADPPRRSRPLHGRSPDGDPEPT